MLTRSTSLWNRYVAVLDGRTVIDSCGIISGVIMTGKIPRGWASATLSMGVAVSAEVKDHKVNRNFAFILCFHAVPGFIHTMRICAGPFLRNQQNTSQSGVGIEISRLTIAAKFNVGDGLHTSLLSMPRGACHPTRQRPAAGSLGAARQLPEGSIAGDIFENTARATCHVVCWRYCGRN